MAQSTHPSILSKPPSTISALPTNPASSPAVSWCRCISIAIEAFDKKGPAINAIITIDCSALKEADRFDAAYKASGPVGPLHGIPVIVKTRPTSKACRPLGSVLFKDYYPDRETPSSPENLRKAGAVILGESHPW